MDREVLAQGAPVVLAEDLVDRADLEEDLAAVQADLDAVVLEAKAAAVVVAAARADREADLGAKGMRVKHSWPA